MVIFLFSCLHIIRILFLHYLFISLRLLVLSSAIAYIGGMYVGSTWWLKKYFLFSCCNLILHGCSNGSARTLARSIHWCRKNRRQTIAAASLQVFTSQINFLPHAKIDLAVRKQRSVFKQTYFWQQPPIFFLYNISVVFIKDAWNKQRQQYLAS